MNFFKKITSAALLLIILLSASVAKGQLPSPTGYVNDFANILDKKTVTYLNGMLSAFEAQTTDEIAIATVPDIGDNSIEDYAVDLYKQWGIGKKGKDNGLLLLIAPKQRQVRIEVGYGLEGIINDSMAGRIIREKMIPYFKTKDYAKGIIEGTNTVIALIAHSEGKDFYVETDDSKIVVGSEEKSFLSRIGFILFFIFIIYMVIRHPWLLFLILTFRTRGGGFGGGRGGFGGGFGGFGGGLSGGGGATGSW
ncbi:MAG: methanol dehydrogenase [Deltaproteobacteria bacterium CG07_land_8_20_14_0_80_38_7]|nr:MAG: methanol dehydrogenase [Deltaproteobacteria bacterium CG07_land_8_20_14_0_80_38_7]